MILRRVTDHMRQQGTGVLVELGIVVLGVFLGMQVNNWNEQRLEDRRAHEFLVRLSADLDQEVVSIDQRRAYVGQSIEYGEQALTWAEDGTLAKGSSWQTVLAFVQASRILPYAPVDTTYQEMRSAGQMGLIRNAALRASLTEYFVSGTLARADYILKLNPEYRTHVRGVVPFRIARYIYTDCFRLGDGKDLRMLSCESPVDEATAAKVLQRFREAPELIVELAYWVDSAHQIVEILQQRRGTCLELKQRVDAEIARS